MKNIFLFLVLLFFSNISFSQTKTSGCERFKIGQYMYVDSSSNTVVIERTNKKQVETYHKTGHYIRFRIKWISDCEYELKQVWSNDKERRKYNGSVTRVLITKTTESSYDYTCMCTNESLRKIPSGTIVKIK